MKKNRIVLLVLFLVVIVGCSPDNVIVNDDENMISLNNEKVVLWGDMLHFQSKEDYL